MEIGKFLFQKKIGGTRTRDAHRNGGTPTPGRGGRPQDTHTGTRGTPTPGRGLGTPTAPGRPQRDADRDAHSTPLWPMVHGFAARAI